MEIEEDISGGIWWSSLLGGGAPMDRFRPAAGVNVPEYKRRRDLAPAAQNGLLAVLFYAW